MFTYQINVEYLGTNFVGWQIQKNGLSVQEVLEKVLSKFLKDKIRVIGSGRTDAGVHASEQSAHFKTKQKILDKNIFINSINFFLSKYPVSVLSIKKSPNKFIFDGRTYLFPLIEDIDKRSLSVRTTELE